MTTTYQHSLVDPSQVLVFANRYLARFHQIESQQPRTLFANRTHPPPFTGAVFDRIETDIGRDLAGIGKALHTFQRVHQTQTRQRADAVVSTQSFHAVV